MKNFYDKQKAMKIVSESKMVERIVQEKDCSVTFNSTNIEIADSDEDTCIIIFLNDTKAGALINATLSSNDLYGLSQLLAKLEEEALIKE